MIVEACLKYSDDDVEAIEIVLDNMTHGAVSSATPPIAIVIQASLERIGGYRRLPETSSEWHAASSNECSTYHHYATVTLPFATKCIQASTASDTV